MKLMTISKLNVLPCACLLGAIVGDGWHNGHTVMLRFAEMLEADGFLHAANLRSARSTDRYVFRESQLGG